MSLTQSDIYDIEDKLISSLNYLEEFNKYRKDSRLDIVIDDLKRAVPDLQPAYWGFVFNQIGDKLNPETFLEFNKGDEHTYYRINVEKVVKPPKDSLHKKVFNLFKINNK